MREVELSACAIFRDEAPYLREWIEFHLLCGVERFHLYDNESQDEWRTVLAPYMDAGVVTVTPWPGVSAQLPAYAHALETVGESTRWLAFIDIDEYLFSPQAISLPIVLKEYGYAGAVGACWACYGTNDIQSHIGGLLIDMFLRRTESVDLNRHVKSIVQTKFALPETPPDPHHFYVTREAVDERHRILLGPFAETPTHDLLRVNHYMTRSAEEAERKMRRPRADNGELRGMNLLDPSLNETYDPSALVYSEALNDVMTRR